MEEHGLTPAALETQLKNFREGFPFLPVTRAASCGDGIRVLDAAVDYFGSKEEAWTWLQAPVRGLGNVAPVDLIATETGALEVTDLIGRLEHGVFA